MAEKNIHTQTYIYIRSHTIFIDCLLLFAFPLLMGPPPDFVSLTGDIIFELRAFDKIYARK